MRRRERERKRKKLIKPGNGGNEWNGKYINEKSNDDDGMARAVSQNRHQTSSGTHPYY